jgi:hypothetical protein
VALQEAMAARQRGCRGKPRGGPAHRDQPWRRDGRRR